MFKAKMVQSSGSFRPGEISLRCMMIEFNLKAKPVMAKPFGGKLTKGHMYLLNDKSVIEVNLIQPQGSGAPLNWVYCTWLSGASINGQNWWVDNGLYQGCEHLQNHKYHIVKEVFEVPATAPGVPPSPKLKPKELTLGIGISYVQRNGLHTTPMTLYQLASPKIDGPVYKCHYVNSAGNVSSAGYYNHKGHFLGPLQSLSYAPGFEEHERTIVGEYHPNFHLPPLMGPESTASFHAEDDDEEEDGNPA